MNNKRNKQQVEEILGSLDSRQKATAPDFFYTRLKARMDKEHVKEPRSWILRPAYAIGAMGLVLVFNAAVLLNTTGSPEANSSAVDNETDQSTSAEYSFTDNGTFDLNQER
jgi:hypothetical protein